MNYSHVFPPQTYQLCRAHVTIPVPLHVRHIFCKYWRICACKMECSWAIITANKFSSHEAAITFIVILCSRPFRVVVRWLVCGGGLHMINHANGASCFLTKRWQRNLLFNLNTCNRTKLISC